MFSKHCLLGLLLLMGLYITPLIAQDNASAYDKALKIIEQVRLSGAIRLELSNLGLTELPPEIKQLINLETLDLSGNQLASLPPEFGQLTMLQNLYLDENGFTSLPPEWENIPSLARYLQTYQIKHQARTQVTIGGALLTVVILLSLWWRRRQWRRMGEKKKRI